MNEMSLKRRKCSTLNYPSGFKELERLTAEKLTAMFAGEITPEEAIKQAVEEWKAKQE